MIRSGAGACLVWALCAAGGTGCAADDAAARWAIAARGPLVISVEVEGALASTESHPLGPPPLSNTWNFKIAMMAPEGAEITAGQPVLGFDPSELRRLLEEYENEADSATKEIAAHRAGTELAARDRELALAQAEAEERKARLKASTDEDIISSIALRKAELDHQLATFSTEVTRRQAASQRRQERAELERLLGVKRRAEQRLAQLRDDMARMTVAAPIDGTVLYVTDWNDTKKKVGDGVWRAEKVLEVVSLAHMKGEGIVDEMDASRLAVGQPVTLRLDANADLELAGEVVAIEEVVRRRAPDDARKIVDVIVELAPVEGVDLRPGMRFRGAIETERVPDALLVPLAAVWVDAGGASVVRARAAGAERVPVELGRRNREQVEVLGGLSPGDRLRLVDGEGADVEAAP